MTRECKVSFFAFLFSLLLFLPHAAHGRLAVHHIHRSLPPHNQHIHRQIGSDLLTGLGDILPGLDHSPDPGGTSSSTQSTNTPSDGTPVTTAPTATTTSSSSDSSSRQTSDPPSSSQSASSPSSPPSTSDPFSSSTTSDSTPTTSPATSSPQSSQSSSSSSSSSSTSSSPTPECLLGVDLLGQCILPSTSSDASPTSVPSSQTQTPTPLTSSSGTTPSPSSPTSSPSPSSDTATSSSLSVSIPLRLPPNPNPPISSSLSSGTASSSNPPNPFLPPSTSSSPTNLQSPSDTSQITHQTSPASSSQSPSPSPTSSVAPIDPCGPLGLFLGLCTTSGTQTGASTSYSSQSPPVTTPGSSSSSASSSNGPSSTSTSTTFSGTNSASLNATSSPPVISFPSYTTGPSDQTTSVQSTSTSSSAPVFTQNTQFSYVTVSSLLGTSFQSSSVPTLTNPDAATTTLSLPDASTSAAGPVPSAPLPADLPARIYPADLVNPSALPSGDVLCSLLFTNFLPWNFVATHTQSQGQIFSWTPIIISQALNISLSDTPPFALQVFVPDEYQSPNDAGLLRTEYLFYLPSNLVSVLANQIRAQSSPFYSIAEPYKDLAIQVDPAFALTSVPNPNAVPGATTAASSRGNKSRTATIIGVVSALGGLALIILGTLIFNGVKRSRQLRHQRLSDPNLPNDPYPDRTGRDFDQDSVGGARRRSFYFAEDSLRGQPQTAEPSIVPMVQAQTQYVVQPGSQIQSSSRSSPENIRERRAPVVPGTISAPILTQSSLNW